MVALRSAGSEFKQNVLSVSTHTPNGTQALTLPSQWIDHDQEHALHWHPCRLFVDAPPQTPFPPTPWEVVDKFSQSSSMSMSDYPEGSGTASEYVDPSYHYPGDSMLAYSHPPSETWASTPDWSGTSSTSSLHEVFHVEVSLDYFHHEVRVMGPVKLALVEFIRSASHSKGCALSTARTRSAARITRLPRSIYTPPEHRVRERALPCLGAFCT
jgi:hypothetical protein